MASARHVHQMHAFTKRSLRIKRTFEMRDPESGVEVDVDRNLFLGTELQKQWKAEEEARAA